MHYEFTKYIMLQIVQYQKSGEMLLEELPPPVCPDGGILVRNLFSVISAGTEKTSVENARGSLIDRARRQPDQVRTVLDMVKSQGIGATFRKVKSKLESFKVLGYSSAGVVLQSRCDEFRPGDRVACAGAGYANHAEIVAIPKNLAVRVPDGLGLDRAAYATVCSIAMQGVRQADPRLGENVAVIGLGLLGQITVQLLRAAGCRVAGADIDESLFGRAREFGCESVFPSSYESIDEMMAFTDGMGFDSVLITASTESNQPLDLAVKIARKKGKAVIVGAVGIHLPRNPLYIKEVDVRISCSYGPGRYDRSYEELGQDYPYSHVRWTENRNMQAVVQLMAEGRLDVAALTSHRFKLKDAAKAYDLITGKTDEPYSGILIEYPEGGMPEKTSIAIHPAEEMGNIRIGFVGAGTFAQSNLLPFIKGKDIEMVGVSTARPANSKAVAQQWGFRISSADSMEIIEYKDVNAVFCASTHKSHAEYVLAALRAGKPIFCEKPLCTTREELREIDEEVERRGGRVMVGFNRRFSAPFRKIADIYNERTQPMIINYRVNAGFIPKGHWVQDPDEGGRIVGEVCHFVDCMVYLTGELPVRVFAESISTAAPEETAEDNVVITVKFSGGSAGSIQYVANGGKSMPKEYCEVFCERSSAVMDNFAEVIHYKSDKPKKYSFDGKKGHAEEVRLTIESMRSGGRMPIPYEEIRAITLSTIAMRESLISGRPVEL